MKGLLSYTLIYFLCLFPASAQTINHMIYMKSKGSSSDYYPDSTTFIFQKGRLTEVSLWRENPNFDLTSFLFRKTERYTYTYQGNRRTGRYCSNLIVNYKDKLKPYDKDLIVFNKDSMPKILCNMLYDKIVESDSGYVEKYKTEFTYRPNLSLSSLKTYSRFYFDSLAPFWLEYLAKPDTAPKTSYSKMIDWSPSGYRYLYDSLRGGEGSFLWQDDEQKNYTTLAHFYFDSIQIRGNQFQFLIRNQREARSRTSSYEKYIFTKKTGALSLYEEWLADDSIENNFHCQKRHTFYNDHNGRPSRQSFTMYLTDYNYKPYTEKREDIHVFRYENTPGNSSNPVATQRKGDFLYVDWCLDRGRGTELLLVNQEMKVAYYNYFPLGQPYFNTSLLPKGKYYLVIFSRHNAFLTDPPQLILGNMISITL